MARPRGTRVRPGDEVTLDQGAMATWPMAATGLPASNMAMRKSTAAASVRNWSALATPPGKDDGVEVCGVGLVGDPVHRETVGPVEVAYRLDHPGPGRHQLGHAPGVDHGPPGPQQLRLLDAFVGHHEGDPDVLQFDRPR